MLHKPDNRKNRGATSVMAVFFVTLFGILAISFASLSDVNVQMARNHSHVADAQAAAESGLAYARFLINDFVTNSAATSFQNQVTDEDATDLFLNFADYVAYALDGSTALDGALVTNVTTTAEAGQNTAVFSVPPVAFTADRNAQLTLQFKQYADDPSTLYVVSTGTCQDLARSVRLTWQMEKDRRMLEFAVASKSPIEITDNSTIGTGIYTDWNNPEITPPVSLAAISTVDGKVNTTLSPEDFDALGYALEDVVLGTSDGIYYDQPDLALPTADDFDTSSYASQVTVLSSGHTTNQKEFYPHAPGEYTTPLGFDSVELNRTVYENRVITDRRAVSGNALFRNCIFEGIFYIGTSDGIGTNNVRFENCVFNGPVITGVPPKFGPEEWKKNVLYFTGDCGFNNVAMEEATILAPNYNVDIGSESANSTLTGLVLGGVVDVRGNANIDGTVVSMADPLELGDLADHLDTNIGISDNGGHTITITPSPDRLLPIGIKTRILLLPDGESYVEL